MLHALESISVINISCVYNHKKEYIMKYIRRLMLNLPHLLSLSMTIDVGAVQCCTKGKILRSLCFGSLTQRGVYFTDYWPIV